MFGVLRGGHWTLESWWVEMCLAKAQQTRYSAAPGDLTVPSGFRRLFFHPPVIPHAFELISDSKACTSNHSGPSQLPRLYLADLKHWLAEQNPSLNPDSSEPHQFPPTPFLSARVISWPLDSPQPVEWGMEMPFA